MWAVKFHALVLKEDAKRIDPPQWSIIVKAIRKKLSAAPKEYGEPLRGPYAGLWKLRVGDYRVIYHIVEQRIEVLVIKIGLRRDEAVYRELARRLKRLADFPG